MLWPDASTIFTRSFSYNFPHKLEPFEVLLLRLSPFPTQQLVNYLQPSFYYEKRFQEPLETRERKLQFLLSPLAMSSDQMEQSPLALPYLKARAVQSKRHKHRNTSLAMSSATPLEDISPTWLTGDGDLSNQLPNVTPDSKDDIFFQAGKVAQLYFTQSFEHFAGREHRVRVLASHPTTYKSRYETASAK